MTESQVLSQRVRKGGRHDKFEYFLYFRKWSIAQAADRSITLV